MLEGFGSGLKQAVDCCENGDELWGFYKIGEFLGLMGNYRVCGV
jgi:hypothetical protein